MSDPKEAAFYRLACTLLEGEATVLSTARTREVLTFSPPMPDPDEVDSLDCLDDMSDEELEADEVRCLGVILQPSRSNPPTRKAVLRCL
jgi:hypothetical protein